MLNKKREMIQQQNIEYNQQIADSKRNSLGDPSNFNFSK